MQVAHEPSHTAHEPQRFARSALDERVGARQSTGPAVFVQTILRSGGLPPHVHHDADEFVYVLQGALNVRVGGRYTRVARGMSAALPRGVVHQFDNVSDEPARMLVVVTTGNGARFLDALAQARGALPEEAAALAASLAQREMYVVT